MTFENEAAYDYVCARKGDGEYKSVRPSSDPASAFTAGTLQGKLRFLNQSELESGYLM